MRLIINGYNIELDDSSKITRTLQVNDIADLENRQANYSATFKIPRSANNVRAFNRLGINGNNSNTPYQRNNVYLYADNEECIVYNGWAVIKETSDFYSANIIDGNIDLYKAIENTTLSDLDLEDVNHFKTLDNVIDSFNGVTDYKYIIADYNGKALYDTNKINIDYLVPSLPVSYLWDKIFETYGFTYEGQVFNTFNYQNLWMSYPKSVPPTQEDVLIYNGDEMDFVDNESSQFKSENPVLGYKLSCYLKQVTNTLNDLQAVYNDIHFKPIEDGYFRIEISGGIKAFRYYEAYGSISALYQTLPCPTDLWLAKNSDAYNNSDDVVLVQMLQQNVTLNDYNEGFLNVNTIIELNENDSFCLVLKANNPTRPLSAVQEITTVNFSIKKVEASNVDFTGALINFDTKDFLKMVLNRFGLTPFKDKYTNHYKFLTLEERLQTAEVEDWSSYNNKFQRKVKESYIYGNYAQQNDFTYKYNDQESTYNDGFILIDNVNLEDSKTVVKSKIYSPEKLPTNIFEKQTNVYKLWDKEVKDDGSVTYKELDKRFYLLRSDNYVFDNSVTIGSETLQTETTISQAPFESFFKLPFNDIIQDYYTPLSQILDKARVEQHEIYLTQTDVVNINFETLKWIDDLNNYYILNKVSNFSGTDIVKCEMIKVNYVVTPLDETPQQSIITINSATTTSLNYTNTIVGLYNLQYSTDNGATWQNSEDAQDGVYYLFATTGNITGLNFSTGNLIRFINTTTNEVVSNVYEI